MWEFFIPGDRTKWPYTTEDIRLSSIQRAETAEERRRSYLAQYGDRLIVKFDGKSIDRNAPIAVAA